MTPFFFLSACLLLLWFSIMPVDKCKLPSYVAADPLTWFRAVEACFHVHGVRRDADKAALVIAALPAKQLQQLSSVIASTSSDQYDTLKRRLISTDAPTFQENWERCMSLPPLRAGEKPTDLYAALTSWLRDDQDPDNPWLRATFISKMPEELRIMLLAYPLCTLQELSVFADSIALSSKRRPPLQVFSMAVDSEGGGASPALPASPAPPPVFGVKTSRPASKQDSRPPQVSSVCWYHQRFGDNAKTCKPGCSRAGSLNLTRPGQ